MKRMPACGRRREAAQVQPPPSEVWLTAEQNRQSRIQLATVAAQPVGGVISTVGRLAFDDRKVAHLFSPVSGRVSRLLVDLGQRVRAGQPLARPGWAPDLALEFLILDILAKCRVMIYSGWPGPPGTGQGR